VDRDFKVIIKNAKEVLARLPDKGTPRGNAPKIELKKALVRVICSFVLKTQLLIELRRMKKAYNNRMTVEASWDKVLDASGVVDAASMSSQDQHEGCMYSSMILAEPRQRVLRYLCSMFSSTCGFWA
jgi:hypothetical protein